MTISLDGGLSLAGGGSINNWNYTGNTLTRVGGEGVVAQCKTDSKNRVIRETVTINSLQRLWEVVISLQIFIHGC